MPQQGTYNEYPQHMVLWRNKKNINPFGLKKSALTSAMNTVSLRLVIFSSFSLLWYPVNFVYVFTMFFSQGRITDKVVIVIFICNILALHVTILSEQCSSYDFRGRALSALSYENKGTLCHVMCLVSRHITKYTYPVHAISCGLKSVI